MVTFYSSFSLWFRVLITETTSLLHVCKLHCTWGEGDGSSSLQRLEIRKIPKTENASENASAD